MVGEKQGQENTTDSLIQPTWREDEVVTATAAQTPEGSVPTRVARLAANGELPWEQQVEGLLTKMGMARATPAISSANKIYFEAWSKDRHNLVLPAWDQYDALVHYARKYLFLY